MDVFAETFKLHIFCNMYTIKDNIVDLYMCINIVNTNTHIYIYIYIYIYMLVLVYTIYTV